MAFIDEVGSGGILWYNSCTDTTYSIYFLVLILFLLRQY